jgi:hypothetical protein
VGEVQYNYNIHWAVPNSTKFGTMCHVEVPLGLPRVHMYESNSPNLQVGLHSHRFAFYWGYLIIFAIRVSLQVTMRSPSRHGRQGGVILEESEKPKEAASITLYEEQRNRRKKELHDEVHRALRNSGFADAAELRVLFTGEVSEEKDGGPKACKESRVQRRRQAPHGATELSRSARNVGKVEAIEDTTAASGNRKARISKYGEPHFRHMCMQIPDLYCLLHVFIFRVFGE